MDRDYSGYLPHINVKDGLARVINNMPLYLRLLGKFKGRELADNLAGAVKNGNIDEIVYAAHALKGTCANMGFLEVCKIAGDIEVMVKAAQDPVKLLDALNEKTEILVDLIEKLKTESS